jgi:glycosyltransferase involved in cell wall biosynthesis
MSALPTLSVIVPNYNHSRYLKRGLEAILHQSAPPTELIVIDDASTDNSMDVLTGLARQYPTLHVHRNERNQGVSYGMKRGMDLARGDYLFFVGADDPVRPGLFEKSLALLAEYPQAGLSCTASEWHDLATGLKWHMAAAMADKPSYLSPEEMVRLGKRGKLQIVSASALFKKQALCKAGGFIPELRWHCDWFATYVVGFRHGICYVPDSLSMINIERKSYYQSGHRSAEHRQVLLALLGLLNSPAYADVRPLIRDSGVLSLFAIPMLRLLLSRKEFRPLINPTLLRRTLWRKVELTGKKVLPTWLARGFLNRFYHGSADQRP